MAVQLGSTLFYCGLSHKYWNYHLCDPGPLACVSPVIGYGERGFGTNGVYVAPGVSVLQDSGAYSDAALSVHRLSFADALKRQEQHSLRYDYTDKILYRASYDFLIDHKLAEVDGGRSRRRILRCSPTDGNDAVDITIEAARFLNEHRNGIPCALNLQGVTPGQYLRCAQAVVPLLRADDLLGLGGWCIVGRLPATMAEFLQTLALLVPFLAKENVQRIHLYGSLYTPGIAACLAICDQHGISMSLDSAYPSFAPIMGQWGYGSWRKKKRDGYVRPEVLSSCVDQSCVPGTYCRGLQRIEHVRQTREWLMNFHDRETQTYDFYACRVDQYHRGRFFYV